MIVPGGDLQISIVLDDPRSRQITLTGDRSVNMYGTFDMTVVVPGDAGFSIDPDSYVWYVSGQSVPGYLSSSIEGGVQLSFMVGGQEVSLEPGTHRLQLFYVAIDDATGESTPYSAELYFDVVDAGEGGQE